MPESEGPSVFDIRSMAFCAPLESYFGKFPFGGVRNGGSAANSL